MHLLLEGGHFYEGARWHDGHFWVSDLYAGQVLRIAPEGQAEVIVQMDDDQPSGLGWLPDGSLLVVGMTQRKLWRIDPGQAPVLHADLVPHTGGFANDMVVDRQGRAYVSNLGFDLFAGAAPATTRLVRVDLDGTAQVVGDPLHFPNGLVVTADGNTLVVAETFGGRLTAYKIEANGDLSGRRCWAELGREPSWDSVHTMLDTECAPDGCAIDAQDRVWVADALHARVLCVADGGTVVDERRPPAGLGAYSCALGGDDGRSLLICTAPDFNDVARKAKAEARLYVCRV